MAETTPPRRPYVELRVGTFEMRLTRRPARLIGWLGSALATGAGAWLGTHWPW
ncbi:hypothetical protein AB0953_08420 [Streptomyces sp. NPDC046866]|uniref:hypothetical protein n=1 Tax=Streptomyces sp. NPDC046866 TaxID=3154921 RepID=UPI0034525E3B